MQILKYSYNYKVIKLFMVLMKPEHDQYSKDRAGHNHRKII